METARHDVAIARNYDEIPPRTTVSPVKEPGYGIEPFSPANVELKYGVSREGMPQPPYSRRQILTLLTIQMKFMRSSVVAQQQHVATPKRNQP
jgi:hypothetical protein